MKRIFMLFTLVLLVLLLAACSRRQNQPSDDQGLNQQQSAVPHTGATAQLQQEPKGLANRVFRFHETVTIPALMAYNPDNIQPGTRMWLQEWAYRYMNINWDIQWIPEEDFAAQLPLLMADGNYPSVILATHRGFSDAQRTQFGETERVFIPLEGYFFDSDLMPNLSHYLTQAGEQVNALKTLSGHMFSAPVLSSPLTYATGTGFMHWFLDSRVAYAVGFADTMGAGSRVPQNTDELLEFLRLVRDIDPNNLGENNVPLGGSVTNSPFPMLLNAFGFLGNHSQNHTDLVAVYGGGFIPGSNHAAPQQLGEVVAMQTHHAFFEYLQFAHILYAEGLICPDFFTLEPSRVMARIGADHNAIAVNWNMAPIAEESWRYYNIVGPMASPINPNRMVTSAATDVWNSHLFFVTDVATPLEIEAAMRFLDMMYYRGNPNDRRTGFAHRAAMGPRYNWGEDTFGILDYGFFWGSVEDGVINLNNDPHNIRDTAHGSMDVFHEDISPNAMFQNWAEYNAHIGWINTTGGPLNRIEQRFFDRLDFDVRGQRGMYMVWSHMTPFMTRNMPPPIFQEDVQERMSDLRMVLINHTRIETARFITGVRPLTWNEFEAYGNELMALGYYEYVNATVENLMARFSR